MIRSLLIDLDGTLLDNEMERFLPAYLERLSAFVADLTDPRRFVALLLKSTQAMVDNSDPTKTLENVFAEGFYPAVGLAEEILLPRFNAFYAQVFPTLKTLTAPKPGAADLVRTAVTSGLEVIIATNPLFPLTAVEQRVAWAGIPLSSDAAPAFLTSYETLHFCKPKLEYFAEILGRLGRPTVEAAMVGDDPELDLSPAQALGLPVYHVSGGPDAGPAGGGLEGVMPWVMGFPSVPVGSVAAQPALILARLRGNLAALSGMLSGLDEATWSRRPGPDQWSPKEIVCHLRDVERDVNLPRLETVLRQTNPFISAADTDRWAQERGYATQAGPEALEGFSLARRDAIARLCALTEGEWARPAQHALLGRITLGELIAVTTDHDLLHLAQTREALKLP